MLTRRKWRYRNIPNQNEHQIGKDCIESVECGQRKGIHWSWYVMKTNPKLIEILIDFDSITEKELCRVQARKSFNNGRYGNALEWALRSQDNIYVTSIADRFLRVSQMIRTNFSSSQNLNFNWIKWIFPSFCSIIRKRVTSFVKMWSRMLAQKCSYRRD